jgi:hypothetical protein
MATALSVGDVAIVHYDADTDAFSFVFLRDVEAGTEIHFTDDGWLAAGGFRPGESTVTYTAPSAIAAGTIVTLTGLELAEDGDQIIAYQGDRATPTILHLIDFGDGNNTAAGDAIDAQTTALPPGFILGVNAVAVAFDSALYAGPTSGSSEGLFAALNNPANWLDDDTLPVALTFNAKPIIDLDTDNSTTDDHDYEGTVTSGGAAVPVADIDLDIDDPDDIDLFAAEIRITGVDVRDLLAVDGPLPPGIVAIAFHTPSGVLRLEGRASHADYEAAIRQVVFSTTDTPGDLKRIQVSVFDGQSWSRNSTAFIEVARNLTAAPPVLDLDANNSTGGGADASATYTAGGAGVPVTDVDVAITAEVATIASATITILGWSLHAGDVLSIAGTLPTGITASSYNPSTGVIALSGAASLADYQTALRQVVYSSTSGAPSTADRGIQVTVNDGAFASNLATMYMHVVIPPPNSAPVLDLDANDSTTSGTSYLTGFTESVPPEPVAIVDTDVLVFDSDNPNLASATVTLTNPQAGDVLTFDGAPPAGIMVSGSGTTAITLTGVALSANYQLALQQIRFSNDSVDPSNITRTIEVVVSDGTSNSNTATAIVQVEAVNNSAPVIDLDPDDSTVTTRTTFRTTFTENGAPIAIADTDTSIMDLDSTTLVSATITLANRHPGDLLTVALPLPGGIVASAYDPGTGVLTLTGTATLDDYEAALQRVLYGNTSDNPGTVDRLVEVVVNDGVNASNVAAAVVSVVPVNDAPVVVLEGTLYLENAPTVTLDPIAVLADPDDADLSQVSILIATGAADGDTLTVGGLTSGTVDGITFLWDAAEHAMVLTGTSSVLNYQSLLRTVGFQSTSDNPTDFGANAIRILTWNVSDGTAVTTTTTTLDILAMNDAPQAAVAAAASYTENAAPVVLSPASTATDVDDITLVAGEVRIVSGAVDGDLLTVNGLQSGIFSGIEFSYDPLLRSLTFTHPSPVADYQAFLQAVAFSSTSDDPTNSGLDPTRTLSWFLFDGDALSAVQTTMVSITALADAPVNTVPGAQSVQEDTPLLITGLSVDDVDSPTLTVTLSALHGSVAVVPGRALLAGNLSDTVTISGTLAEVNLALASVYYLGDPDFSGPETLTMTSSDGALSDSDTVAVTVTEAPDAPVLDLDGNDSSTATGSAYLTTFTEDGPPVILTDIDLVLDDADSPNLVGATFVLLNANPDDVLVLTGSLPGTISVDFTGNQLTLSGIASVADYAAALALIAFDNPGDAPDTQDRLIQVTVDDGTSTPSAFALVRMITQNDAPVNTVPAAQTVSEDTPLPIAGVSVADADGGALATTLSVTSGILNVAPGAGVTGNGTAAVTIAGAAAEINAALSGLTYTGNLDFNGPDTLTVTTDDGTAQDIDTIAITVNPVDDAPVLDLDADDSTSGGADYAATFTEGAAGVPVADIDLTISGSTLARATITLTNPRPGDRLFVAGTLPDGITAVYDPGTGVLTLAGDAPVAAHVAASFLILYTNDSDNPPTEDRVITVVVNDGTRDSNTAISTIHVAAVNNAPVHSLPLPQEIEANTDTPIAGLSVADEDAGAGTLTTTLAVGHGMLTVTSSGAAVSGSGTNTVVLTGTLAAINATLASVVYRGSPDDFGADALTITTDDGGNSGTGGSLSDSDQISLNLNTHLIGTSGDDAFTALPGNERIDALAGIDTITFGFRLVDASVTYVGNQIIIDSASSHTVLTGFESYVFTDGTVNNNDGDWLVDDLFYYSRSHDLWNALADADAHYHAVGWHEDRDPSAFFSTPLYLSAYPDVQAAGTDPLVHWHDHGWIEGRLPSLTFDPRQYLENNPDVAAAGIDPLAHFLRTGAQEGRQPYIPVSLPAVNGVDYMYYLQNNPDVAAAGMDPYEHYMAVGWKEGRDPNAYFDTSGYLEHYTDVAAAGMNPLQHYNESGWREGRDPSVDFDTLSYLAANPDVAAAGYNPLDHFLQFGIHEGRDPFGDGVWHG